MEATNNVYDEELNSVPNIPQEIISDILSNLPVNSLLKFRCVCKSWKSLISSSHFINTHLNLSSKSNNMENYSLVLASCNFPIKFFNCTISSILTNSDSIDPMILDFPVFTDDPVFTVVGACNGLLLCLTASREILFLCNPTTKKFKKLRVKIEDDVIVVRSLSFGFCYDKLNDDYKVVELFDTISKGTEYETKVKVYSLRDNNWRDIAGVPFLGGFFSVGVGICLSGILHWCVSPCLNDSWIILSLNIETYLYAEVEIPKYVETSIFSVHCDLGEFGGYLGVMCNDYTDHTDIWVMKEYDVKESWIKLMSIPYPVNLSSTIFTIGKGEVIFNYASSYVMLYNSRNNSSRKLEILDSTGCLLLLAGLPYIESLVPLTLDG